MAWLTVKQWVKEHGCEIVAHFSTKAKIIWIKLYFMEVQKNGLVDCKTMG
jgi:hypothetical protein